MKEKIILKVKDILNTDILHDPDLGHTLFLVVSEYLNEANKIVLDFKDIKFVNNAFFNNSIGKLLLLDNFDIKNNNLVICGHSYKAHFGNLYKLKKGDLVIFTDVLNNKYIYEVELVEELLPTSIKEMIESDFDLTLYTCTKDALKRVVIRCNMVSAN